MIWMQLLANKKLTGGRERVGAEECLAHGICIDGGDDEKIRYDTGKLQKEREKTKGKRGERLEKVCGH